MSRWLFLRHGATIANQHRWLSGWMDIPLLPQGQWEAASAGESLGAYGKTGFSAIYTSDLVRAWQTAVGALVAAGFTLADGRPQGCRCESTPALRERHMGDWQGWPIQQLRQEGHLPRLLQWDGVPPGGESLRDVAVRALDWLSNQPDEPSLVVAHGGTLRVLTGLLDGEERSSLGRHVMENASILEREIPPGRWAELRRTILT